MNIRKIIKEELEKVMNKQESEKKFDHDIHYLKGFSLNKKEEKGDNTIWVFDHKEKDYILRFYIQKNNSTDKWNAKVFIYWKEASKDYTNAKGKDYDASFGPFDSYEEMVSELNRKLHNNPLISLGNYVDDDNTQFDKDVVEMLKQMMKKTGQIDAVKDVHFKDLKKIHKATKNIKTEEELHKYINENWPDEEDKQTLLLILQKIYQLRFYLHKEKLESLF